jgi:hypothetical protein
MVFSVVLAGSRETFHGFFDLSGRLSVAPISANFSGIFRPVRPDFCQIFGRLPGGFDC